MNARDILVAVAVVVAAGALPVAVAAQSPASVLPKVGQTYQTRSRQIDSGQLLPLFQGSASVVQKNYQNYMASIGLKGVPQQRGHYCGGVIVAPHWILTAAHCASTATRADGQLQVTPMQPDRIQVLTGSNVLFEGKPKPVSRIVVHPKYGTTARGVPHYDLALLETAEPLGPGALKLATEAQADRLLRPGVLLQILGWGSVRFGADSPISATLLSAYVDVVDQVKCDQVYGGEVTAHMFCAGVGAADSCQGDSGGPAVGFLDGAPVLVGITSWGAGCCCKDYPGVYVNVARLRGWIDATIGKSSS